MTFYQVVIKKKSFSYLILKRFNDFVQLHETFSKNYDLCFDKFPSKITFYRSKESVLKERRAALQKFLNHLRIVAIQNLENYKFPELYDFLEISSCKK